MEKVASIVSEYIALNPVIKEGLRSDLINYSKLARKIIKDPQRFDAAVVAIRRYSKHLQPRRPAAELLPHVSDISIKRYSDLVLLSFKCDKRHSQRIIAFINSCLEENDIELVTMSFADHRIVFIVHEQDLKRVLSLF